MIALDENEASAANKTEYNAIASSLLWANLTRLRIYKDSYGPEADAMCIETLSHAEAIREALVEEMRREIHGAFKVTKGILEEFGPERVRDAPIYENAIIGAAIVVAIMSYRPVQAKPYLEL